jgi:hypothetical protein
MKYTNISLGLLLVIVITTMIAFMPYEFIGNTFEEETFKNSSSSVKTNKLGSITPTKRLTKEEILLLKAANTGNLQAVNTLIEHGVNVNAKGQYNITPLYLASYHGYTDVVNKLIWHDADIHIKTETVILEDCYESIIKDIKIWRNVVKRAQEEFEIRQGKGSLFSYEKELVLYLEEYEQLIDIIAEINDTRLKGVTPLIAAAQNGHFDITQLLVAHGAQIHEKDASGLSAFERAQESGHELIVDFFKEKCEFDYNCNEHVMNDIEQ